MQQRRVSTKSANSQPNESAHPGTQRTEYHCREGLYTIPPYSRNRPPLIEAPTAVPIKMA